MSLQSKLQHRYREQGVWLSSMSGSWVEHLTMHSRVARAVWRDNFASFAPQLSTKSEALITRSPTQFFCCTVAGPSVGAVPYVVQVLFSNWELETASP
eukprot:5000602-Amphidinium_carterae.1